MGALVDYWYYTGDDRYNALTTQGLLHQIGPSKDYMPPNQTRTEGNDDQGFWGMAVMSAAEYNFPNPPPSEPGWLALAQAVFNTQAWRWDTTQCGGGLRWQVFQFNNGWDYKNSISQACFFNLAARLALYTGNSSYARWADRTWEWMEQVRLIDENYYIYDGVHVEDGCTDITPWQFSYNAGAFLLGAAAMYNYSSLVKTEEGFADKWKERIDGLLTGSKDIFFRGPEGNIMAETACEPIDRCNIDQQSFKAYLSRWMAATTKWAPWTYDFIMPLLRSSAVAAAKQCTGGDNGRMCGLKWTETSAFPPEAPRGEGEPGANAAAPILQKRLRENDNNEGAWDGSTGVGQQMAAMEVVLAGLIEDMTAPVTEDEGGTSDGDPNAGGYYGDPQIYEGKPDELLAGGVFITDGDHYDGNAWRMPPPGDAAGGVFVTLLALGWLGGFLVLMLSDEHAENPVQRRVWRRFLWLYGLVTGKKRDESDARAAENKASESEESQTPQDRPQPPSRPHRPVGLDGPERVTVYSEGLANALASVGRTTHRSGTSASTSVAWADRALPPLPTGEESTMPTNTGKQKCTLSRRGPASPVARRDGTTRPYRTRRHSNIIAWSTTASLEGCTPESSSMASARAAAAGTAHSRSQSSILPNSLSQEESLVSSLAPVMHRHQRPHINERSSSLYHQAISPLNIDKTLPLPPDADEEDE